MADIDKLNIDSIIQRLLEGEGRRGAARGGGGGGGSGTGRVWGPVLEGGSCALSSAHRGLRALRNERDPFG